MNHKWYYCLPTLEGIALVGEGEDIAALCGGQPPSDEAGLLHLPSSRRSPLAGELPLGLQLPRNAALCALRPSPHTFAFTEYGPGPRDKVVNQDSALAATIPTPAGDFFFAAVADGVSTRTLWPERAARLACLCGFLAVFQWVRHEEPRRFGSREDVQQFRDALALQLRTTLEADRHLLERGGAVSPFWERSLYERLRLEPSAWYNTTLLLACFGPGGGVLMYLGDGGMGLHLRRSNKHEQHELLVTDESTILPQAVSLGVRAEDFKANYVSVGDGDEAVVYLASDGIDRTLQRVGDHRSLYAELLVKGLEDSTSSGPLQQMLVQLSQERHAEQDNWSIAGLKLEVPDEQTILRRQQTGVFDEDRAPSPTLDEAFGMFWQGQPGSDAEQATSLEAAPTGAADVVRDGRQERLAPVPSSADEGTGTEAVEDPGDAGLGERPEPVPSEGPAEGVGAAEDKRRGRPVPTPEREDEVFGAEASPALLRGPVVRPGRPRNAAPEPQHNAASEASPLGRLRRTRGFVLTALIAFTTGAAAGYLVRGVMAFPSSSGALARIWPRTAPVPDQADGNTTREVPGSAVIIPGYGSPPRERTQQGASEPGPPATQATELPVQDQAEAP